MGNETPFVENAEHAAQAAAAAATHPSVGTAGDALTAGKAFVGSGEFQQLEHDALPLLKETKSGYKTTEFWGAIAAIIADLGLDLGSKDKIVVSGLAAFYALARGLAKSGVPTFEP